MVIWAPLRLLPPGRVNVGAGNRRRRKVDIAKTAHVIDLTEDDEGNG